jgi:hypothetical protein
MNIIRNTASAAALVFAAHAAGATTIDLAGLGYEIHSELQSFDEARVGLPADGVVARAWDDPLPVFLLRSDDKSDPAMAAFSLFQGDGRLAARGASARGETVGTLQYLFEGVRGRGAFASLHGGAVLVEISADDLIWNAPLSSGTITVSALSPIAAIPLPAGGLLVVGAIGALGAMARRRRS